MNKMKLCPIKSILKYLFLSCSIFLILSCAKSSKPVEYYMLDASVGIDNNQTLKGDEGPMIGLGPIRLPEYLDRFQMVVAVSENDTTLSLVALACETDFVAKNEDFINSVKSYADKQLEMGDEESFKSFADEDVKKELVVRIGENIQVFSAKVIDKTGKTVGSYVHSNKKVAAVVVLAGGEVELAKEISMHVAAMQPEYLKPEDVPADVIAKEKEIYKEQLIAENKPADMLDKIIEGKLNKFYEEVCLVKQLFIKDDKKSIEQLLSEANAQIESYSLVKI